MRKAFLFDMDGVIVNSEPVWEKREDAFLSSLLGETLYKKIKPEILGSSIRTIYNLASRNGFSMKRERFFEKYNNEAITVYAGSEIARDIEALFNFLVENNFILGLVTSSPVFWINQVFKKIRLKEKLTVVLSLNERSDLKPKPAPDGYIEAMRVLNVLPEETIILEDSNKGLRAAKSSGALTICYKEFLPKNYRSAEADLSVNNIKQLIRILERRLL